MKKSRTAGPSLVVASLAVRSLPLVELLRRHYRLGPQSRSGPRIRSVWCITSSARADGSHRIHSSDPLSIFEFPFPDCNR